MDRTTMYNNKCTPKQELKYSTFYEKQCDKDFHWPYATMYDTVCDTVSARLCEQGLQRKCKTKVDKVCEAMLDKQYQIGTTEKCHIRYSATTSETVQDRQYGEANVQRHVKDRSLTSFNDQQNCHQDHRNIDPGLGAEYLAKRG